MNKWITEFCQEYSLGGPMSNMNCDAKPTLKLFFYNLYRKIRAWSPVYNSRMGFQRIFRLNHLADCDIWEAQGTMAKRLLPILYAFKKYPRNGYPNTFSEYDENTYGSLEKYNKLKEEGKILGGGPESWEKEIDHMIHSLEYIAWESSKKITKWYIDNFGADPYAHNNENKYIVYEYEKDGCHCMSFHKKPEEEGITNIKERICYGNSELLDNIETYVTEGLQNLGKYFRAFWD